MVRRYISADPDLFTVKARELATAADAFIESATRKDAVGLAKASDNLAGPCEGCHAKFWYPEEGRPKTN
jgi:cytochrome c556